MATLAFDGSQPATQVGYYTYTVADGSWDWSPGMYALHGFEPREVPATTDVLLRHKHPEDRSRTFAVMETALQDGEPFSCYHRIIDRHERIRSVLSVGRGIKDAEGKIERLEGFFVDLTAARRSETEADVETALARIAEHRAVIEQAKGMVMLSEACDAEAAFGTLRSASQNANVKLHEVAQRLVSTVASGVPGGTQVRRFLDAVRP
jgi:hypothetical protein